MGPKKYQNPILSHYKEKSLKRQHKKDTQILQKKLNKCTKSEQKKQYHTFKKIFISSIFLQKIGSKKTQQKHKIPKNHKKKKKKKGEIGIIFPWP